MKVVVSTLAAAVAMIGATLATAAGSIEATTWACHNFGNFPVALAAAFIAGATIMHAVDRALAARIKQAETQPKP
jgi:hypothetical protein